MTRESMEGIIEIDRGKMEIGRMTLGRLIISGKCRGWAAGKADRQSRRKILRERLKGHERKKAF